MTNFVATFFSPPSIRVPGLFTLGNNEPGSTIRIPFNNTFTVEGEDLTRYYCPWGIRLRLWVWLVGWDSAALGNPITVYCEFGVTFSSLDEPEPPDPTVNPSSTSGPSLSNIALVPATDGSNPRNIKPDYAYYTWRNWQIGDQPHLSSPNLETAMITGNLMLMAIPDDTTVVPPVVSGNQVTYTTRTRHETSTRLAMFERTINPNLNLSPDMRYLTFQISFKTVPPTGFGQYAEVAYAGIIETLVADYQ